MAYQYRETPRGGPVLSVTSCGDQYGAVHLTIASAERDAAITICVDRESVPQLTAEIDGYSRALGD